MRRLLEVMTQEDVKTLSVLASEIWHEYWRDKLSAPQVEYMIDKFQSYNAINNQINNENYIYKMIEVEGEIEGYLAISPKREPVWNTDENYQEPYLFLSKLYVKKASRGNGLGRFALNEIIEFAKKINLHKIILTVNKYNTASIKAYEKWGFKTVESVVTDIGQGFVMDDYIMVYEIPKEND